MNDKSIRVLEFNKIREGLRKYAITESAKILAEELSPFKNKYEIENALLETKEALDILVTKGSAPFEGFYDIKEALNRASKGGVLSPGDILRVGNSLSCARKFKEFMKRDEGEVSYPKIEDLVGILEGIKPLEDDILRAIVSEDEISDKASAVLYDIRRTLREKNSSVREKINSLMKSNSQYLQDNLYTIRGDRYVLPVRAEYKGAVPGLVHDQSSTGATLFIEPMSLVNLNNEIKELMLKEKSEIHRILSEFSVRIQTNGSLLFSNYKILTKLDFIFAKGKYGSKIRGNMPMVNDDGTFEIFGGRHPLIDPKIVVPSDVYLGGDFTTLMITGPNTGGKTVTLKTVGLIHMMGMSGLLIPAKDGSSIGIYEEIFGDIGDEQSIEQSLSTFSSHMTNIVKILENSNKKSLVLLDELGAGTDPIEGAALAISILEELRNRGAKIIATTHYSELKGYALKTEGVENAS
ncbi:MAG: endonuclease MutS2, partial [Clostridium sp.]